MNAALGHWLSRRLSSAYCRINKHLIFRFSAQNAHDRAIEWLRLLERLPLSTQCCRFLRRLAFAEAPVDLGGLRLSQRLILAAGLIKGDGFASESIALHAVKHARRNIIPGWSVLPALLGPVEFGSFTRNPRLGNPGTVIWRDAGAQSTQNRIGLRNPGARAAARFLSHRREQLPPEFGINIALSPAVDDIDEQERDLLEALTFFLDAGVFPSWFTLNLSCPNTEDDPQAHQLESETRQLCGAFIERLRARRLDIPLWVKLSPRLAGDQYRILMRVFHEVGVKAVIATNTLAQPSPDDDSLQAGVGGRDLFPEAVRAVQTLLAEKNRMNYAVDIIACGGILDGASLRHYLNLGVKAGQYWSALVYRGPFAAAIIENELAQYDHEFEAVRRQSPA